MTQAEFAKSLGIGQSTLGMMEVGKRDILDRHVKVICSIFNVNETWFRTGKGEMFIQSDTFSLDEYAKKNNLTPLEIEIMKCYMEFDPAIRKNIIASLRSVLNKYPEEAATSEDYINGEVEAYRSELEATQKGRMLSVSGPQKEKLG